MHVNLLGPSGVTLGMGSHFFRWASSLNYLLEEQGHTSYIGPVTPGAERLPWAEDFGDPKRFRPNSPTIAIWHLKDLPHVTGKPRILYTVWETSRLHEREAAALDKFDVIAVPTNWHANILKEHYKLSSDRVWVIHEGSTNYRDRLNNVYFGRPVGGSPMGGKNQNFSFIGKLEKRKGIEPMLDALATYCSIAADKPLPQISVFMHVYNPFIPQWFQLLTSMLVARGFRLTDEITIPGCVQFSAKSEGATLIVPLGQIDETELAYLAYYSCNWAIYPYYAEGWGIPLADSLASGVIPICQNYSGPSEYLKDGLYLPLSSEETIAKDNYFFDGSAGTWRQVTSASILKQLLVAVNVDNREQGLLGDLSKKHMAKNFSWRKSAEDTVACLMKDGF